MQNLEVELGKVAEIHELGDVEFVLINSDNVVHAEKQKKESPFQNIFYQKASIYLNNFDEDTVYPKQRHNY